MFSNNKINYKNLDCTNKTNDSLWDGSLPQNYSNGHFKSVARSGTPFKETRNSTKSSEGEKDLINLMDDFHITSQGPTSSTANEDKTKQITNLQIKMLEEFLSTTSRNTYNSQMDSPELTTEFQKFYDRCEAGESASAAYNTLSSQFESSSSISYKNLNLCTPNTPTLLDCNQEESGDEDIIDELLFKKNLQIRHSKSPTKLQKNQIRPTEHYYSSIYKTTSKNTSTEKDIMKEIILTNKINFMPNKQGDHIYNESLNSNILELVTQHNIKYLEAVKRDDNNFQKRSVLKTDSETLHLTPGPTLYEKSVALPQIMHRLAERKKSIEDQLHIRKKIVLDSGPSFSKSPDIDEKFKTMYYIEGNKSSHPKTCFQSEPKLYVPSTKANNIESATSKSYQSSSTHVNQSKTAKYDDRLNCFPPVEKLKALRREQLQKSNFTNSEHEINTPILRPLELLKENCNKDRYVALATQRVFEDFIKNGK